VKRLRHGLGSFSRLREKEGGVSCWTRRARPLLGTLVEIGVPAGADAAVDAAFATIAAIQARLSRFDAASDIAHFHALPPGEGLEVDPHTATVLAAAQLLHEASGGLFDISLGSAPHGWRCDGRWLVKLDAAVRMDLGGIGKGYAIDEAVDALRRTGCTAGWVNAGGDLRVFGDIDVPLELRDEVNGGVRRFGTLADGAFATSGGPAHVSVAAPLALWADALTKVVAASGNAAHPLLARHMATAWLH